MANSEYTPESLKAYNDWFDNITLATRLRKKFSPTMMTLDAKNVDEDCEMNCSKCSEKLNTHFGDYSKPLVERFVACPTNTKGHGYWVSAINMCIN